MSRRPARCTEADLKRVIKAASSPGTRVVVEIPTTGPIRVTTEPLPATNDNATKRRITL
jgi:hypothetical protein